MLFENDKVWIEGNETLELRESFSFNEGKDILTWWVFSIKKYEPKEYKIGNIKKKGVVITKESYNVLENYYRIVEVAKKENRQIRKETFEGVILGFPHDKMVSIIQYLEIEPEIEFFKVLNERYKIPIMYFDTEDGIPIDVYLIITVQGYAYFNIRFEYNNKTHPLISFIRNENIINYLKDNKILVKKEYYLHNNSHYQNLKKFIELHFEEEFQNYITESVKKQIEETES